jgi:hypothetical protein
MVGRKISVQAAVKAALEFAKLSAPKTAGVLSIILLFDVASVVAPSPDPMSVDAPRLALKVFEVAFSVIAQGALYRLAFAGEHGGDRDFRIGPLGLQWGRAETRLLGANLLLYFLFFIALLFLAMILIVVMGAGMFVGGSGAASLKSASMASPTLNPQQMSQLALDLVPLLLATLYVYLRVCLYAAATVTERKVLVFSTWRLTRGNVWPILAASIVIALPLGLLNLLASLPGEPRAASIVLELMACVVDAFLVRPMSCGLYAYIYTALRQNAPAGAAGASRGPWG